MSSWGDNHHDQKDDVSGSIWRHLVFVGSWRWRHQSSFTLIWQPTNPPPAKRYPPRLTKGNKEKMFLHRNHSVNTSLDFVNLYFFCCNVCRLLIAGYKNQGYRIGWYFSWTPFWQEHWSSLAWLSLKVPHLHWIVIASLLTSIQIFRPTKTCKSCLKKVQTLQWKCWCYRIMWKSVV